MPAADRLAQHPLYRELLSIGRHQRSIRPEALFAYPQLLGCAEVARRMPRSADPTQLAVAASGALREAVETIIVPDTRTVAEAALCVTPEFEGLQIAARVHKLPGIDDSSFKRQRRRAFAQIIAFLTRRTSANPLSMASPLGSPGSFPVAEHQKDDAAFVSHVTALAASAARVHYAGLGMLFVHHLDDQLSRQGYRLKRRRQRQRSESIGNAAIGAHFFAACVEYFYLSFSPGTPPYFFDACFADEFVLECNRVGFLDSATADELVALWRMGPQATPLAHPHVTLQERGSLVVAANGLRLSDYMSLFRPKGRWQQWLDGVSLGVLEGPFTNVVARLVSTSGMFGRTLGRDFEIPTDTYTHARQRTVTAIEDSYWHVDAENIVSDKSLTYTAESYLAELSPVLTNRAR
jgi:hypothetical protein